MDRSIAFIIKPETLRWMQHDEFLILRVYKAAQ
jgi:hypothetical protein